MTKRDSILHTNVIRVAVALIAALCVAIGPFAVFAEDPAGKLFPPELVDFVPYAGNPVFTAGAADAWDAHIRERGWILKEGDRYYLWYTGYRKPRPDKMSLGLATSSDGIHWRRDEENPIYDDHWVEDMMVVHLDGTYYMFAEGKNDEAQLLTSPDRRHWTRQGKLDVRYTDGRPLSPGPFGTPTAWHERDTWYLFYERRDAAVWLAASNDMKVWTNVQDEPVLKPGPDEYDHYMIALNQIVNYKGRYYGYYHAKSSPKSGQWSTNVATSSDLVHWTKYAKNPIQQENKSSGILVHDGQRYRLYTMHDQVNLHFPRQKPAAE